jgi:hypothetical protein
MNYKDFPVGQLLFLGAALCSLILSLLETVQVFSKRGHRGNEWVESWSFFVQS